MLKKFNSRKPSKHMMSVKSSEPISQRFPMVPYPHTSSTAKASKMPKRSRRLSSKKGKRKLPSTLFRYQRFGELQKMKCSRLSRPESQSLNHGSVWSPRLRLLGRALRESLLRWSGSSGRWLCVIRKPTSLIVND